MTLKEAKAAARLVGCSLRSTEYGEYRVNFSGAAEASASYHTDLDDAVDTARAMAAWRKAHLRWPFTSARRKPRITKKTA